MFFEFLLDILRFFDCFRFWCSFWIVGLVFCKLFFPTCQVRVVRFYVSCLLLSSSSCSTATLDAQCSLSDLNHDHPRPVFPAGPQPRPSPPSVPCRTSTTTIHAQCSLPDLNREYPRQVFPAGPHVGRYGTSVLVDLRRGGGLEDADWWLAIYVMLTRARKLKNLILLGFTEQVEELLRRGPPTYLRELTDKLETKAASTLERLQSWPVYDALQASWHSALPVGPNRFWLKRSGGGIGLTRCSTCGT